MKEGTNLEIAGIASDKRKHSVFAFAREVAVVGALWKNNGNCRENGAQKQEQTGPVVKFFFGERCCHAGREPEEKGITGRDKLD